MCSYDQYNGCYDQILSGLKCARECSEVENYNPNKIDPKNTCTSGYIYLLLLGCLYFNVFFFVKGKFEANEFQWNPKQKQKKN